MHQSKFTYENKERAITQKLSKLELRFMCTVLHLDEIYPVTKFHNCRLYTFGDMLRQISTLNNAKKHLFLDILQHSGILPLCTPIVL